MNSADENSLGVGKNNKPCSTVLVVDDEGIVREALSRIFKRSGFEVIQAETGEEAIRQLSTVPVGIVFTDLKMPGMGGVELLKYVRETGLECCVNIVTGIATLEGAVECMRIGACDYIAKPFNIAEIVAKANRCLGHCAQKREIGRLKKDILHHEELDRLKSDFVSNVSHELRTPLFAMGVALDLLFQDSRSDGPEEQLRTVVHNNYNRLSQVIHNVLNFSRMENGTLSPTFKIVRLQDLGQKVISDLNPLFKKNRLESDFQCDETLSAIEADPDQLEQVFVNLLGNAIKFTPVNGKIGLRVFQEQDMARICVWDTGRGISPENQQKIFERFFQVDSSLTRESGGSGIGLSLVRSIVHGHGGHVWVQSKLGEGSEFHVSLPIKQKQEGGSSHE